MTTDYAPTPIWFRVHISIFRTKHPAHQPKAIDTIILTGTLGSSGPQSQQGPNAPSSSVAEAFLSNGDADSKNAVFASTYAFSLYRKGRYQEAAKVMANLKPEELEKPGVAAYNGVFLAAAGDKSRAAESLKKGLEASLLPEEKLLVQNARNKVNENQA